MIPQQYRYLNKYSAPRVIVEALKLYGVTEAHGSASNPVILQWAEEIGKKAGIKYNDDSIPWCGLFCGVVVKRSNFSPPNICVRASSWDTWGNQVRTVSLGDILRFNRPGGGHVGFYVGEDDDAYHVLGGNQKNMVCIDRLAKQRLVTARRCPWKVAEPDEVRPIILTPSGVLSENEV